MKTQPSPISLLILILALSATPLFAQGPRHASAGFDGADAQRGPRHEQLRGETPDHEVLAPGRQGRRGQGAQYRNGQDNDRAGRPEVNREGEHHGTGNGRQFARGPQGPGRGFGPRFIARLEAQGLDRDDIARIIAHRQEMGRDDIAGPGRNRPEFGRHDGPRPEREGNGPQYRGGRDADREQLNTPEAAPGYGPHNGQGNRNGQGPRFDREQLNAPEAAPGYGPRNGQGNRNGQGPRFDREQLNAPEAAPGYGPRNGQGNCNGQGNGARGGRGQGWMRGFGPLDAAPAQG